MIFNKDVLFEDGRTLTYHRIVDRKVDIEGKLIQPIMNSWETYEMAASNSSTALQFRVDLPFDVWDPMLLLNLEERVIDLEWIPHLIGYTPPPPKSFAELKADKSLELNMAAQSQIYEGYTSDALGTPHHYPAKDKDQTNMVASVTDSYNPTNTAEWVTPFWCEDANGVWAYRVHTAAQIQKAGSDGKLAILAALSKNAGLQALVASAETEAELSAIEW